MIQEITNGYATKTSISKKSYRFQGAIYEQNGSLIPESQRIKDGNNEWNPDDPNRLSWSTNIPTLKGRSLYLGHYTGHYGHFLLETLNRFWFLLDPAKAQHYDNFIFHPFLHKTPNPHYFSPARICFECFGIDLKKFRLIEHDIRLENVTIPEPYFNINYSVNRQMGDVYRKLKKYAKDLPSAKLGALNKILGWKESGDLKIYMSRRKTRGYRPMLNEAEIERVFEKFDFKVLHPEKWSFERQLAIYDRTTVIAGVEGSGLHNSVFMNPGTLVLSLGTPRVPTGKILNQDLCNSLSGVYAKYIEFDGRLISENKGIYNPLRIEEELIKMNLI